MDTDMDRAELGCLTDGRTHGLFIGEIAPKRRMASSRKTGHERIRFTLVSITGKQAQPVVFRKRPCDRAADAAHSA